MCARQAAPALAAGGILELILLCVLLGLLAGLLAGTLGLGGGVVIVPALLYLLPLQGIPLDQAAPMAVATSLATIAFTSMSAIHSHHRLGALRWPLIARLSLGIIGGALAGAQLASIMPGAWLAALFGFFAIVIALQMLASGQRQQAPRPERLPGGPALVAAGAVIGTLSSLFGIGGGSLTVPFLSWRGVVMQQAVAAAAACGLVIAIGGCLGFLYAGWGVTGLPAGSAGYVYLPAAAAIVVASVPMARVGALLAHRLPAPRLRQVFAVVLLLIGVELVVSQLAM